MAISKKLASATAAGVSVNDSGSNFTNNYSNYVYTYNATYTPASKDEEATHVFSADGREIVFTSYSPTLTGGTGSQNGIVIKNIDNLPAGVVTPIYTGKHIETVGFTRDGNAIISQTTTQGSNGVTYYNIDEQNLANGGVSHTSSGRILFQGEIESDRLLAASSDGGKVAFYAAAYTKMFRSSLSHGTYVEDLSNQQVTQIGDVSTYDSSVKFDSALDKAIYLEAPARGSGGNTQLYVEDVASKVSTRVATTQAGVSGNSYDGQGLISKSGSKVAFTSPSSNLSSDAPLGGLFVKDLTDQSLELVAADQPDIVTATTRTSTINSLDDLSPDGQKVAFTQETFTNARSGFNQTIVSQIQIRDLTTHTTVSVGAPVTQTRGFMEGGGSTLGPIEFSPDSARLTYTIVTPGNGGLETYTGQLFVYDTRTGQTMSLAGPVVGQTGFNPSFSPDGQKIAFNDFSKDELTTIYDFATGVSTTVPALEVAFSADSSKFAYDTLSNETSDDTNSLSDVYVASMPVCFTTGTLIRTSRGEVAVENLAVGDIAVTATGGLRPITWIGHRDLDGLGRPLPHDQQPVRIRRGAFGQDVDGKPMPARELRLSPGHPVLVGADEDGVLVPIMCLINGTTIAREPARTVTYWHIELDGHDILLAEGLPAESYYEMGSRAWFAGADNPLLDPDFVPACAHGRCRRVAIEGAQVRAERARLDVVFAAELASHSAWDAVDGFAWLAD